MSFLQHYFNSLHVFCLLVGLGFGRKRALRMARAWERMAHPVIYWGWGIPALKPVPVEDDRRWRR